MSTSILPGPDAASAPRPRSIAFSILTGLTALVILLQGVWAGVFLEHDGERGLASTWITVHARGAEVAIALTLVATIVAFVRLRHRRDLWIGSGVLLVLLIVESYLGGEIRAAGKVTLTIIHVPLAMAIMGLAVWIPVRTRLSAVPPTVAREPSFGTPMKASSGAKAETVTTAPSEPSSGRTSAATTKDPDARHPNDRSEPATDAEAVPVPEQRLGTKASSPKTTSPKT